MNTRLRASLGALALAAVFLLLTPGIGSAQQVYKEDFTGTATIHTWYFFNGACLTAGTTTATNPGTGNGCTAIDSTYYSGEPLVGGANGTAGPTQTLPDPALQGALRLTNGCTKEQGKNCNDTTQPASAATNTHTLGGGHHQNGAIISADTFNTDAGLSVTFKTVTYRGDGGGGDGADGISFFLMDGSTSLSTYADNFGAFGGSLGYTCTNQSGNYDSTLRSDGSVRGFDGMVGAYMGLGIDEYGNFLNGSSNTLVETDSSTSSGDNTATGGFFKGGRIGLRGRGNISWKWLNANYPSLYPSTLLTQTDSTYKTKAGLAVHNVCATGKLSDNTVVDDYTALPGAYKVLSGVTIANESAIMRGSTNIANTSSNQAYPITYNLKITTNNLLSLSYSYNGGSFQPVITGQSISNGTLPSSFRFGFAGSTGGASNIHEIMCFKAAPSETSNSSGGINVYQNPTVKTGTQLYLASYFPNDWSGQLTATNVLFDKTLNTIIIAPKPTWDARCVLTGVTSTMPPCSTGATSQDAEAPASRVMLTWSGTAGIPFEWASLSTTQKNALDSGDATQTSNRLSFLRGDRTNELTSIGTCPQSTSNSLPCFRARTSVLGDIVDASPTWAGPPQTYGSSVTWTDSLYPNVTPPERNVSYTQYTKDKQTRQNVVYVGANDGFVHGFRAGSLDGQGNMVANSTTPNDGYEVLAYMPGAVLNTIHSSTVEYDYANQQYSHQWFVDATPATGDLMYGAAWHTWLVGGLGAGGAAFYALDITDPSTFSEANAANVVLGEWTPSTITCQNVSNCGQYMGSTYGTPQIRRFHNGSWGVIFGNGYGSSKGTAGIYIMLVDPTDGSKTFYYLASGSSTTSNGIANPASLDMDLDHVVDYIYGGDLQGNIWRWDVTDKDPTKWTLSANQPLFTTPNNQPITAGLTVGTFKLIKISTVGGQVLDNSSPERVIVGFGTGQQIPQSLTSAAQYASGQQYLFGIWDWNFSGWNNTLKALPRAVIATGSAVPSSITMSLLKAQTITTVPAATPAAGPAYRTVSNNYFCYAVVSPADTFNCSTPGIYFGWSIALPATMEQTLFSPSLSPDGEFVVNTYIPSQDSPLSCNAAGSSTGFTMGVTSDTGGGQNSGTSTNPTGYFRISTTTGSVGADGVQLNGTGIPMFLSSGQKADNNTEYLITQTSGGAAQPIGTNRHVIVTGKRVNWVQRR